MGSKYKLGYADSYLVHCGNAAERRLTLNSEQMADLSRQYISSLSILVVTLFIGVPIWWKTTEVYRCPLPYNEIEKLRNMHVSRWIMSRWIIVSRCNACVISVGTH